MKIDLLKKEAVDRSTADSVQYKMIRGRITALLITLSTTIHFKDKLTVKLRGPHGTKTVVDRVSLLRLALLTDLKKGMPTTGSPDYIGTADGEDNDNAGYVAVNQGIHYYLNAVDVPLGHITLDGAEELEITVDLAAQAAQTVNNVLIPSPKGYIKISSQEGKTRLDTLLTYDESKDLESTEALVREIYVCGVNNTSVFLDAVPGVYGVPLAKDINIKLGVDGDDSENDIESHAAMTAINGQFTSAPSSLIRVFQDLESLPASVYVKVYGDDAQSVELLYIREDTVPHMIGQSMDTALEKEKKRVETLESNDPEKARALVQAGVIAPSEKIAAAQAQFVPAVATPTK